MTLCRAAACDLLLSPPLPLTLPTHQVPEGLLPEVKEHNLIRYSDPDGNETYIASSDPKNPQPNPASPTSLVYASSGGSQRAVGAL